MTVPARYRPVMTNLPSRHTMGPMSGNRARNTSTPMNARAQRREETNHRHLITSRYYHRVTSVSSRREADSRSGLSLRVECPALKQSVALGLGALPGASGKGGRFAGSLDGPAAILSCRPEAWGRSAGNNVEDYPEILSPRTSTGAREPRRELAKGQAAGLRCQQVPAACLHDCRSV